MIWINWKFIKIRKRKREQNNGWRVFTLNIELNFFSDDLILGMDSGSI